MVAVQKMSSDERVRLLGGDGRATRSAPVVGAAPEPRVISPLSPSGPLPSGRDSIDSPLSFAAGQRRRRRLMLDVLTLSIGVALTFVSFSGAQQIETTLQEPTRGLISTTSP